MQRIFFFFILYIIGDVVEKSRSSDRNAAEEKICALTPTHYRPLYLSDTLSNGGTGEWSSTTTPVRVASPPLENEKSAR